MRRFVGFASTWLVLTLVGMPAARADWSRSGNPVSRAPGAQHDPISANPWVAWIDERSGLPQLYATWISDSTGLPRADFPLDGAQVALSGFAQRTPDASISSWDFSLYVVWSEDRGTGSGADIYMMRMVGPTPAPGWPAGGLLVCGAPGDQILPRQLVAHPYHVVVWEDSRDGVPDVYAADLTESGALAPGWPLDGKPICSHPDSDRAPHLLFQYQGPVVYWERTGRIMAQAISWTGDVPRDSEWPADGLVLSDSAVAASRPVGAKSDPNGDIVVVAWEQASGGHAQIWAQGLDRHGFTLAADPVAILSDTLAHPHDPALRFEDNGQLELSWSDTRSDAGDLYYRSVYIPLTYSGLYPQGPPDGVLYLSGPGEQSHQITKSIWQDARSGSPQISTFDRYSHEVIAIGPSPGVQTQPATSRPAGIFIPEDPPLPVVVWTDTRNAATAPDIYAQVMGPSGPGSVGVNPRPLPRRVTLSTARPTPSRGVTTFTLSLPAESATSLAIVDVSGRRICSIANGQLPAGEHPIVWNGIDAAGARAAPGLYWINATVGSKRLSQRIVLLER